MTAPRRLAAWALRRLATEVEIVEVRLGQAVTALGRATDWLDDLSGQVLGCGCTAGDAEGCGHAHLWIENGTFRREPCPCPCHAPERERGARVLRALSARLAELDEPASLVSLRAERWLYEVCGAINALSGWVAGCGCTAAAPLDCSRCYRLAEPCACHGRPL